MNPLRPFVRSLRRERGMAMADELLDACRPMDTLSASAHARVKRRLETTTAGRSIRLNRWPQPVVAAIAMLMCGAASGIAIDRLVRARHSAPTVVEDASPSRVRTGRARLGRHQPARLPTQASEAPASDLHEVESPVAPPATANATVSAPSSLESGTVKASVPVPPRLPRGSHSAVPGLAPATSPKVVPRPRPLARTEARWQEEASAMANRAAWSSAWTPHASLDNAPPSSPSLEPARTAPGLTVAPSPSAAPPGPGVPPATIPAQAQPFASPPATTTLPASSPGPTLAPSEERSLATAVRALRADKDPRAALRALDDYRRRYPGGRLAIEAAVLRIDALTEANRSGEALGMLDRLDLARLPGGLARHAQRGELRARAGRWAEARADFDWVLAHASEAERTLLERALWGRAQCFQREGHRAFARSDASVYLQRFPGGRFASQAEQLLKPTAP